MIAAWMVFAIVTGCTLTVAAIAADRFTSLSKRPRRFVWLVAMLATTLWPGIAIARGFLSGAGTSANADLSANSGVQRLGVLTISVPAWDLPRQLSLLILVSWVLVSLGLAIRVALSVRCIRRRRAGWPMREIDGVTVLLAADAGPAVIGLRQMHMVLPEWVLGIDPSLRELILRHEREHRSARDPYLLLIATVLTALFPWSLPLWFQARRLRIAIEIDCDARVLRANPRWREYAHLLVTIAERQAIANGSLTPALSEPTSNLERRITAMRTLPELSRFNALCLSAAVAAAFALACSVNEPQSPDRAHTARPAADKQTPAGSAKSPPLGGGDYFEFQVDKLAIAREMPRPEYPAALKHSGIGGSVQSQFVVDETGHVDMQTFKLLISPGPEFTAAVQAVLPKWQFEPATVHGRRVKQVVQQEFLFQPPPGA